MVRFFLSSRFGLDWASFKRKHWAASYPGTPLHGEFSNLGLVTKGIYQLLVLALVFLYIGRIRGWSFASFGFQIYWKLTGLGVLLFVPAKLIFVLRRMNVSPNTAGLLAGQIALPIIIISSIIMGIFEELMEVGYIIKVTEKYGCGRQSL